MFDYPIANRYANSLIGLAVEKQQLERVREDMLYLKSLCELSPEFLFVIKNPLIPNKDKKRAVSAVCSDNVCELVMVFLHLLITKNREGSLLKIIKAFFKLYDVIKERHKVVLITAVAVNDSVKQTILDKLKSEAGIRNIQLECVIKSELIGGFILEYDGKRMDASLRHRLSALETQFERARVSIESMNLSPFE